MLDFSSMKVCLLHQSEESLILCPSDGALSKGKSAFALSTRLMLASLKVTASLIDLLASARHVHSTMNLPMIMASDANVWHPHFNLGRTRSVDALIVPIVDLLASSCGLRLCNPRDQAIDDAGAALDLVFISSPCEAVCACAQWNLLLQ